MRLVVQKVSRAAVEVAGRTVGVLDSPGLVVLVGVTHDDTAADAERLADKVWNLRILDDERSCAETGAPLLVVSQFTLYADAQKGRRPSFIGAAPPEQAEPLVARYAEALRALGVPVQTGVFRANMQVEIHNDGPVTILLEK